MKRVLILMIFLMMGSCTFRVLHPASYNGVKPEYVRKTACRWHPVSKSHKVLKCKKRWVRIR
jgi:hypothetical protein